MNDTRIHESTLKNISRIFQHYTENAEITCPNCGKGDFLVIDSVECIPGKHLYLVSCSCENKEHSSKPQRQILVTYEAMRSGHIPDV